MKAMMFRRLSASFRVFTAAAAAAVAISVFPVSPSAAPSVSLSWDSASDGSVSAAIPETGVFRAEVTTPSGNRMSIPLRVPEADLLSAVSRIPLSEGDGTYRIDILTQVHGSAYAVLLSERKDVTVKDPFSPFTQPNCFVCYDEAGPVAEKAAEIAEGTSSDAEFAQAAYSYVTEHIRYDTELAAETPVDYIPSPEDTLEKETGVCFDYAALYAALLRSRGIPAKVQTGFFGEMYHAWVSVYLDSSATIGDAFSVTGGTWSIVDPTIGANNSPDEIRSYIGRKMRYTTICSY